MLSRVADALYWMSRYVERAEHAARVLEVVRRMHIDLAEVDPGRAGKLNADGLRALGLPETPLEDAILNDQITGSIADSIFRARENARQVQEVISSEMWNYLNQAHWQLEETRRSRRRHELLVDLLSDTIKASFLWGGVTDATMGRGAGWLFIRLGQFVERTDRTSRIFASQWRTIESEISGDLDDASDNFAWLTLLRSCGSLEAYRKQFPTRMRPKRIVEFIILDPNYPRTIRYSTAIASEFVRRLGSLTGKPTGPVQRSFGKLAAKLEYAEIDDLLKLGPAVFVEEVAEQLHLATAALQKTYFLH